MPIFYLRNALLPHFFSRSDSGQPHQGSYQNEAHTHTQTHKIAKVSLSIRNLKRIINAGVNI